MRTALYYPHTRLKSEGLLKTALLLWDNLEYIVPYDGYGAHYADKGMNDAIALIGKPLLPSEASKRELHELVEDFATQDLPNQFYYQPDEPDSDLYEIYPEKLLPDTWHALQDMGLASGSFVPDQCGRQALRRATGLWLMSLLADCCAGTTRARVTDRGDAYASVYSLFAGDPPSQNEATHDVVIPLTLNLINAADLPLKKLIKFREREEKETNGYQLRGLRHQYLAFIEDHINDLRSKNKPEDRAEAQRCFESDARDKLKDLQRELGIARKDFWISQPMIATLAVSATATVGWLTGAAVPIPDAAAVSGGAVVLAGGMLRAKSKLADKRKNTMQQNSLAYLYELQRQ